MNDFSTRRILLLVALSMGILILLSAVPWSGLTGNYIKDFSLFSDVMPKHKDVKYSVGTPVHADPETDFAEDDAEDSEDFSSGENGNDPSSSAVIDSIIPAKALVEAPVDGDLVLIESYLPEGRMLPLFREALEKSASQPVRIAMLGDSYIEGDIMAQDLRDMFQKEYGGRGVGFVPLHSDFPGFRSSVKMSDSGWKLHDIRTMKSSDTIRQLSGDYSVVEGLATTSYRGTSKTPRTASWNHSAFMFIAPDSAVVTVTTDAGVKDYSVPASGNVQCIDISGETSLFKVSASATGLIALGAYIGSDSGVQLDCMSIRGNSGLPLRKINPRLCGELQQWIDYDLIILEYGMNSVNAEELEYSAYGKGITKLVRKLKNLYPGADILVLGVGDRGVKDGAEVVSLPTCQAMVNAQRKAAAEAGVHFWDTRAAMGGENAIAEWRKRRLVNADYIHLNHDGGRELAERLFKAMTHE